MIETVVNHWIFRLFLVSLFVMVLERARPWRRDQPFFGRPLLAQDLAWVLLNSLGLGLFAGGVYTALTAGIVGGANSLFGAAPSSAKLLTDFPLWFQIPAFFLIVDFCEWCIHNLLHRVSVLWRFHRVHHSIHVMDWLGNFRFHPIEPLIYHGIKVIPLALLGGSKTAAIAVGTFSALIGTLNHANLNISYGPFRYFLNSPRMHIWHHEAAMRGRAGVNFGVVFSCWDWIFRTAHMPPGEVPRRIGFEGDERFPDAMWWRLLLPFMSKREVTSEAIRDPERGKLEREWPSKKDLQL